MPSITDEKNESAEFLQILMLNKEQTLENRCQKVYHA